ncbi:aryl-sulfate sulfotransferase [bacterium]|nr:aryl-sulfate sulfotransferase [bacterium]
MRGWLRIRSLIMLTAIMTVSAGSGGTIRYLFPQNGSTHVGSRSPVIVRFRKTDAAALSNPDGFISVTGSRSGIIAGETVLSDDSRTFVFRPAIPFGFNEAVRVHIRPRKPDGHVLIDTLIVFHTAPPGSGKPVRAMPQRNLPLQKSGTTALNPNEDGVVVLNGVSVPSYFPGIHVLVDDGHSGEGAFFCNTWGEKAYFNIIMDNQGAPLWYMETPFECKNVLPQGNRLLTVRSTSGTLEEAYTGLDSSYRSVKTYVAPEGYALDDHELNVLPDGHYLLIVSEPRVVDMGQVVAGGKKSALMLGTHLVEMDTNDQPVLIWRCWDHFRYDDPMHEDLTQEFVDYVHMNSAAQDIDGHLLISSRNLCEITKINRETGEIIWRLGGKHNQFEWVDFDEPFCSQHDIRVLPNGHYTMLDNGNYHNPPFARALEIAVDTAAMTVTKIWEYRDSPDMVSFFMGSVQRLPGGNTLIWWGSTTGENKLTEVHPDGSKAYEMHFSDYVLSYRIVRHPWQGRAVRPYLIIETKTDRFTVLMNQFGDGDVQEYRVYAGTTPDPETVMAVTENPYINIPFKTLEPNTHYYFRTTSVSSQGFESLFSNQETATTPPETVKGNLIINGDFSQGSVQWELWQSAGQARCLFPAGEGVEIDILHAGEWPDDLQLRQGGLTLVQGAWYRLQFDAWADAPRTMEAYLAPDLSSWPNYSQSGRVALKVRKQHFQIDFPMQYPTDNSISVIFSIGSDSNNVHIDRISLMQLDPNPVEKTGPAGRFILLSVYPNPFNPNTSVRFSVPEACLVWIDIVDVRGRTIRTLPQERCESGYHTRKLSGTDLCSGVYFCRLNAVAVKSERIYRKSGKILVIR